VHSIKTKEETKYIRQTKKKKTTIKLSGAYGDKNTTSCKQWWHKKKARESHETGIEGHGAKTKNIQYQPEIKKDTSYSQKCNSSVHGSNAANVPSRPTDWAFQRWTARSILCLK